MANLVSLLVLCLTPLIYAYTSVSTVLDDITSIHDNVNVLTAAVAAYQGGLLGQTPLLAKLTVVQAATGKGATDANGLPSKLSYTDSETIINYVNQTLSVGNPAAVKTLESKEAYFQATGTAGVVADGLKILLSEHLAFSNAVGERIPQELVADANEVVDVITNALE